MKYKSKLIQQFHERGYIHQATNIERLDDLAKDICVPAYIGFDCTADSLHVGSLVQIMMLRILQKTGHKPIVLMGGGTTKIGDPSGKDAARPLLSDQDINTNKDGIKQIFEKYLKFGDQPCDAVMVDNANWLNELDYIKFLRDYGTHFSVNRLLSMDSVKLRLEREQPLSFLEFNYAILQAYDFLELRRRYGCILQMGGSDQWGNIVTGVDLTRRADRQEIFGITSPLITTSSGSKMGKSAQGAIWLNEQKISTFDFWQFWRNTEDADVHRFLCLFTELPIQEVDRLGSLSGSEINEAKIILANEVTKLCHGESAAKNAQRTAKVTYDEGGVGKDLLKVSVNTDEIRSLDVVMALRMLKLANSNGEARRLIRGGGARLNDKTISDEAMKINLDDFIGGQLKFSAGKKRHAVLEIADPNKKSVSC